MVITSTPLINGAAPIKVSRSGSVTLVSTNPSRSVPFAITFGTSENRPVRTPRSRAMT